MSMTLKEAMAERGLTAADLGAFFGVTEAHAVCWMNHQSKIHFKRLGQLRTEFLRMGIDSFAPIREELTGVQYDDHANYLRRKLLKNQKQPAPGLKPADRGGVPMSMTLKEAMAERGLTAADLGAFFGVTEAHAARWMNHQNKIHYTKLHKLRTDFLCMGLDEFTPIFVELRCVQYDPQANRQRWKAERKLRGKKKRPIRYPCRYGFGLTPEQFAMVRELGGEFGKYGILYRKIIDFAIRRHPSRIKSMRQLIGMSLEDLRKAREKASRGPIDAVVQLTPKQYEKLNWLALSRGMTIEQTIKDCIFEYYKIMKGQQV